MKKKIVISGYYGFNNLGDEAILHALLQEIRNWEEDLEILVLSGDPDFTSRTHGVAGAQRWPLSRVKEALENCDIFLTGGGSLLQDKTGFKSIPYYLGLTDLARRKGARNALICCGIGPISRPYLKWFARWQLEKMDFLSVRDSFSRELLQTIGVQQEPHLIPDPVFLLHNTNTGGEGELSSPRPRIIIAPRSLPGAVGLNLDPWIDLCTRLQQDLEGEVVLWPLHSGEDRELCRAISSHLQGITVMENSYSIPRYLEMLQAADLIIGVRLHALIMGAVSGASLLWISYDPKVKSLLEDLGLSSDLELDNFSPEEVAVRAGKILRGDCEEQEQLPSRVASLGKKSRQGMQLLRDFVRRDPHG